MSDETPASVPYDLTDEQRAHVRDALKRLCLQRGSWKAVSAEVDYPEPFLDAFMRGEAKGQRHLAAGVARALGVDVEEIISGEFRGRRVRADATVTRQIPDADLRRGLACVPPDFPTSAPLMDAEARTALVEQWTGDFAGYRARAEQAGTDLWVDLVSRLARVGVSPAVLRQDIELRRARGWTLEQLGPVLDALAMATHRSLRDPKASADAAYARSLVDAMGEHPACSLAELAAQIPWCEPSH